MIAHRRAQNTLVKKRMEVAFLLFVAAILVIIGRLVWLQWVQAHGFLDLARKMQGRILAVDASRGRIKDRAGYELAADVLGKAIAINPRVVRDPALTAGRLAELLGLPAKDREAIRTRIVRARDRKSFYAQLRRGVERKLALQVEALAAVEPALRGVWLEDCPIRVNPCGRDGIQLVGQVSSDRRGIEALELKFDRVLRGRNGEKHVRVDAMGAPIPESETRVEEPVDGQDVQLTIDRDIQHFVEAELDRVAEIQRPDAASAIVLDVQTGQVLAMAAWPTYRPGARNVTPAQRRGRAVTDLFEPGSTFKVFTAAAALEYGVNASSYCGGSRAIGNRTIHCAHGAGHGAVDLRRMVQVSCNLTAGALAERIGSHRLYSFLDRFGFQRRTGIEFPGEEFSRFLPPSQWKTMRTVNVGFGQGIAVTPIQLVAGFAAIGNDGLYVPPTLVLRAPGADLPKREPLRVMSAAGARILRSHMEQVVTAGTGKNAKIPGYSVAGKTGTAQIAHGGRYIKGAYVASFYGFLPVDRPRLAIGVSVWHPRRDQYGGPVSAPVFREIARQSVAYLRIPPDDPSDRRDGADRATFARYARHSARGFDD